MTTRLPALTVHSQPAADTTLPVASTATPLPTSDVERDLPREVVLAEAVESAAPDCVLVDPDAVLEAFLQHADGRRPRLVPGPWSAAAGRALEPVGEGRASSLLAVVGQLRAGAWAEGTQLAYGTHVRAWRTWCRQEGVAPLPLDPAVVSVHLADYALSWDEAAGRWRCDDDGHLVPRVAVGTVSLRLAALNRLASFLGLPRPGDDPRVQELLRGLRRSVGVSPLGQRRALDLTGLHACLAAADRHALDAARLGVTLLLRARVGATAGQLSRLGWGDVDLYDDRVELRLAPVRRNGQPRTAIVPAHPNSSLCLVAALRLLRSLAPTLAAPVLARPDGGPLTRQALHLAVVRASVSIDDDVSLWERLPTMRDRPLGALLAPVAATASHRGLIALRDRAILLLTWWTALRRSNVSALNWADLADHGDDGFAVRVRRAKNDQEGRGRTVWLPAADPSQREPCPARALRAYRGALATALCRPVAPTDPVFVQVRAAGTLVLDQSARPRRLGGDAVNELVQRLVVAAGLMSPGERNEGRRAPYGAHSLRAGFVTEALRDDKLSVPEVAEVTGHKSVDVLMRYRREVNGAKRNPGRRLLAAVARQQEG